MSDREKVREVFAEVSDAPEEDRPALLQRMCGDDAELRSQVESLLAAASRRPRLMSAPDIEPREEERAGARVGPYRVLHEVGQGGFGTVYVAEQESPVQRRVALKILKLGMDTRAVVARFEAERQALAMMEHEHIAKVYDAGATASGRPYFVMELVLGEPITAYADKASLSIAERLELFVQVCQGVQHAHSKGIIHRDLKPGNVLVSTQDGRAHAKIIDFGIAKATEHRLTEKTLFTEFRHLVGTPEYMSPEQAGGAPDVDTRSDVYSLGVLLYELLTGATPFDPGELRAAAYAEIQRIIREVDPQKPSTRLSSSAALPNVAALRRTQAERLGPLITGDLDWITMKALDKDRARRYETPGALAADIERHLSGRPVEAAPPSAGYRARKFVRRNRVLVGAGSAVAAALVLGMIGTTIGLVLANSAREREQVQRAAAIRSAAAAEAEARRAVAAEEEQSRQRQVAVRERDEAWRVTNFLQMLLRSDDPRYYAVSENVTMREVIDGAVRALDSGYLADAPNAERALRLTLARTYLELSRYDEARAQAQRAQKLLNPEPADAHHRGMVWTLLAAADDSQGKIASAEELYRKALALAEREYGPDDIDVALARMALAGVLSRQNRLAEARPLLTRAMESIRKAPESDRQEAEVVKSMNTLAMLAYREGNLDEAISLERQAIDYARSARAEDSPTSIVAKSNLGTMLTAARKPDEAESVLREALQRAERVLGPRHERTGVLLERLASVEVELGRHADAESLARRAVEVFLAASGESSEHTIRARITLASALERQKKYAQALPLRQLIDRALADDSTILRPDRLESLLSLAMDYRDTGDQDRAEVTCRRAVTLAASWLPDGHARAWYRHWVSGSLGFQIAFYRPYTSPSARLTFLREAEPLLTGCAESIDPPGRDRQYRKWSIDRVVALYELMDRLEPGSGHGEMAAQWKLRAESPPR